MPVEVSQPSLVDDEEEELPVNKGKRKRLQNRYIAQIMAYYNIL